MTKPTKNEALKPCPICGGEAYTDDMDIICEDGRCPLCEVPIHKNAWQSLPRQSSAAREVAAILSTLAQDYPDGHRHRVTSYWLRKLAARLEAIGDVECERCKDYDALSHKYKRMMEQRDYFAEKADSRPDVPAEVWVHYRDTPGGGKVIAVTADPRCGRDLPGTWNGPIPVHGATISKTETVDPEDDESELPKVRPVADPDCDVCKVRFEYEGLHERVRHASRQYTLEMKTSGHWYRKSARYLRACKRIHREWKDMRERRDDYKLYLENTLTRCDAAEASVDGLQRMLRLATAAADAEAKRVNELDDCLRMTTHERDAARDETERVVRECINDECTAGQAAKADRDDLQRQLDEARRAIGDQ